MKKKKYIYIYALILTDIRVRPFMKISTRSHSFEAKKLHELC